MYVKFPLRLSAIPVPIKVSHILILSAIYANRGHLWMTNPATLLSALNAVLWLPTPLSTDACGSVTCAGPCSVDTNIVFGVLSTSHVMTEFSSTALCFIIIPSTLAPVHSYLATRSLILKHVSRTCRCTTAVSLSRTRKHEERPQSACLSQISHNRTQLNCWSWDFGCSEFVSVTVQFPELENSFVRKLTVVWNRHGRFISVRVLMELLV
jgi:hypothetical protein